MVSMKGGGAPYPQAPLTLPLDRQAPGHAPSNPNPQSIANEARWMPAARSSPSGRLGNWFLRGPSIANPPARPSLNSCRHVLRRYLDALDILNRRLVIGSEDSIPERAEERVTEMHPAHQSMDGRDGRVYGGNDQFCWWMAVLPQQWRSDQAREYSTFSERGRDMGWGQWLEGVGRPAWSENMVEHGIGGQCEQIRRRGRQRAQRCRPDCHQSSIGRVGGAAGACKD
jgi:hypothetical protein